MDGFSISATVLAGAVGGLFAAGLALIGTILTTRWRIAEENVLRERAKWRASVRKLITRAAKDDGLDLRALWVELALRMNPRVSDSRDDRELVALVKRLPALSAREREEALDRIVSLAAHILKHDWERAKWEADRWFWERDQPAQSRYAGPERWGLDETHGSAEGHRPD